MTLLEEIKEKYGSLQANDSFRCPCEKCHANPIQLQCGMKSPPVASTRKPNRKRKRKVSTNVAPTANNIVLPNHLPAPNMLTTTMTTAQQ